MELRAIVYRMWMLADKARRAALTPLDNLQRPVISYQVG